MTDVPFLRLSENWCLATDNKRWILQRRRADGQWYGYALEPKKKRLLMVALAENGVPVTDRAKEQLAGLPDTFQEFIEARDRQENRQLSPQAYMDSLSDKSDMHNSGTGKREVPV